MCGTEIAEVIREKQIKNLDKQWSCQSIASHLIRNYSVKLEAKYIDLAHETPN